MLDDVTRDHFFAEVYELTTAPFMTAKATQADVSSFLSLAQPPAGSAILDLGCGWGRHLEALRRLGHHPIGIERSASLAAKAQARVPGAVLRADLRALPLVEASVDAAACFYSSIFLFDEPDNAKALAEVARVLKPGAAFVLQTSNPIHLRRQGPQSQTFPLPDGSSVFESAAFDSETGRETGFRKLTKRDGTTHEGRFSVRYYAPGELEAAAFRAGLKVERVCGDHQLGPLTRQSRDLIALMRKPQ